MTRHRRSPVLVGAFVLFSPPPLSSHQCLLCRAFQSCSSARFPSSRPLSSPPQTPPPPRRCDAPDTVAAGCECSSFACHRRSHRHHRRRGPSPSLFGTVRGEGYEDGEYEESDDGFGVGSVSWLPPVLDDASSDVLAGPASGSPPLDGDDVSSCKANDAVCSTSSTILLPLYIDRETYVPHTRRDIPIAAARDDGDDRSSQPVRLGEVRGHLTKTGGRHFVTTLTHPTDIGTFARYGTLASLDDVHRRYDCFDDVASCTFLGRVKIRRIANVDGWQNIPGTCPLAEVEILRDEVGGGAENSTSAKVKEEEKTEEELGLLNKSLVALVGLQRDLEERVKLTDDASDFDLGSVDGDDDPDRRFWRIVTLWLRFVERRHDDWFDSAHRDFWSMRDDHYELTQPGSCPSLGRAGSGEGVEAANRPLCPTAEIRGVLEEARARWMEEMRPFRMRQKLAVQIMLEFSERRGRLALLRQLAEEEMRRLEVRRVLLSVFGASDAGGSGEDPLSRSAPSLEEIRSSLETRLIGGSSLSASKLDLVDEQRDEECDDEMDAFQ